jgi:hypothetical protein
MPKVILSTVTNLALVARPRTCLPCAGESTQTWLHDTSEDRMTTRLAWNRNRDMWIRLLEKQTGERLTPIESEAPSIPMLRN